MIDGELDTEKLKIEAKAQVALHAPGSMEEAYCLGFAHGLKHAMDAARRKAGALGAFL